MCAVLSHFSCVRLFVNLWTAAHQAPLSMGFSRREYRSGLPFSSPGGLPRPRIEPTSLHLLQWQAGSLPLVPPGKHSCDWPDSKPLNLTQGCHLMFNE